MADYSIGKTANSFVSWMNRLWDSLPVSQAEKDYWNAIGGESVEGHEETYDHTKIATSAQVTTGSKSSATDAGTLGDISITDDYIYFCVQTGTAGNAIWKKAVVFAT